MVEKNEFMHQTYKLLKKQMDKVNYGRLKILNVCAKICNLHYEGKFSLSFGFCGHEKKKRVSL